jgi:hypothetical protein
MQNLWRDRAGGDMKEDRYTILIKPPYAAPIQGVVEYSEGHAKRLCAKYPNYEMVKVVKNANPEDT